MAEIYRLTDELEQGDAGRMIRYAIQEIRDCRNSRDPF